MSVLRGLGNPLFCKVRLACNYQEVACLNSCIIFCVSLTPSPHIHSICFRRTCYWYLLHFKGKLRNHISVKSKLNVRGVGRGDCRREKNIQTWKKLVKLKKKRWNYVYCPTTKILLGEGGSELLSVQNFSFIHYQLHFLDFTATCLLKEEWGGGAKPTPQCWIPKWCLFCKNMGGGVAKPPLAPTVLTPMNLINLIVSFKFPIVQTQRRTFHLYLWMWYPLWTDKKFS